MTKRNWTVFFDHAAVATESPEKLKFVLGELGLHDNGSEDVASQGVRTYFLKTPAHEANIELLEVLDPNGVVAKFLAKRGAGVHHLSFLVSDIEGVTAHLLSKKIRLVYEKAKPGAHHTLVNFIHPESTGGVLLEFAQKLAK